MFVTAWKVVGSSKLPEGSVMQWNFVDAYRNLVLKLQMENLKFELKFEMKFWNLYLNLKFDWNLELPKNSEIIVLFVVICYRQDRFESAEEY